MIRLPEDERIDTLGLSRPLWDYRIDNLWQVLSDFLAFPMVARRARRNHFVERLLGPPDAENVMNSGAQIQV